MQWYRVGTIAVTNGSAAVAGTGTLWGDVGTLNPGDIFTGPDSKLYEVLAINSNTSITLNSVYSGSTASAQAYSILPIGLLPSTLALQVKTTLATANTAITTSATAATAAASVLTNFAANPGSSMVGHLPVGIGSIATTVQDKLRELDLSGHRMVANTQSGPPSFNLLSEGKPNVIIPGATGTWNAGKAGMGRDVVWDHVRQLYVMLDTGANAAGSFSIGMFTSIDGVTWTAYSGNPIFSPNTATGWDYGSVGTPSLYWDNSAQLWHMFYEGFPTAGYEQGASNIGHATAADLAGPWVRDAANPVVSGGMFSWVTSAGFMYHPSVVKYANTYYLFANAGSVIGQEDISCATSSSINGPWTAISSPVISRSVLGSSGVRTLSDPYVWRSNDMFWMYIWNSGDATVRLFYSNLTEFPTTWHLSGYVNFNAQDVPVRLNPCVINGEFIVFGQILSATTVSMYTSGAKSALLRIENITGLHKQFAAGNQWGTIDITGPGGARRAYISVNSGSTVFNIGACSGSIGSEIESPVFTLPTSAGSARYGLGGTSNGYPGAKQYLTRYQFRLADDSGFCPIQSAQLYLDYVNTATVGNVTINKAAGRVIIAAGSTSLTVTNSLVTPNAHVLAIASSADATLLIKSVVPGSGTFTINVTAAATQSTIDFVLINAD